MKYQEDCERTESIVQVNLSETDGRLLHAMIGMCTETGEFADALKRHIFYGKSYDPVNLKEEIGDILWYVACACNALELDMQDVMDTNIAKLKARYGEKFSEERAENRNLELEREILSK